MTAQPPAATPQPMALKIDLGPIISKAWGMVKADLVLFIVGYLIVAILAGIPLVGLIIGGPIWFGFIRVVQKRYKGEPAEIGQIFDGFKDFSKGLITFLLMAVVGFCVFVPMAIVAVLLAWVIPFLGAVLAFILYLCGIVALMSSLYFVLPIAALSNVEPMDAIKASFKFLFANIGPMVLLALVTVLIAAAGALACGVGILVTAPLAVCIQIIAYNECYLPNAQPNA